MLDGVFHDEHGDFPACSYIRNPPESSHTPGSAPGCTIFVKLWQFDMTDRTHVRIDTNKTAFVPDPDRDGVELMPLFHDDREDVRLERWEAGNTVSLSGAAGMEILVLDGTFEEGGETFEPHSWLRIPKGWSGSAVAGPEGAKVWIKRDHLAEEPKPPA